MSDKLYISPQSLLDDSFRLGAMILESGFRPSFIIALWRGGAPVGIAVQEFLAYNRIRTDHIAVRTASYSGIDSKAREVQLYGTNYLVKNVTFEDRLLIVDDVFDTGQTINALIEHLREKARRNTPGDIRIAVPYYKPERNQSGRIPDYFIHETSQWIKFPHSLEGLTVQEMREHRPSLYTILQSASAGR
ncbi:MAG: phosphoribosyltransferase family protein [Gammaproteobacteria bacterium]|jgi:hypoxanthine phosphoribosyltransferase|nr:phosphoribosyltransferase family protein [Gammaproteobacteria bacterium]